MSPQVLLLMQHEVCMHCRPWQHWPAFSWPLPASCLPPAASLSCPPPACLKDITSCESEATKKGVQVVATQKALDKLGKEAAKAEAEREKMTQQQQASMQVGGWVGEERGVYDLG